jgi:uncharacterized membrane protein YphA (DoxX/SURF4 family)
MITLQEKLRKTKNDKPAGVIRIIIGIMFLGTGLMKYLVPMAQNAWSKQLIQGKIPFYSFNLWFFPALEILTAFILIVGFFSRLGAFIVVSSMMVAIYVHVMTQDPSLFPFQPKEPIVPVMIFILGLFLVLRGGGAWSYDLKHSNV